MKEFEPTYSKEEAEALGYDFEVVEFFKKNYPELLKVMWGSKVMGGSDLSQYQGILYNLVEDDDLERDLTWFEALLKETSLQPEIDFFIQSIKAMIEFRGVEKGEYIGKPVPKEAEMVDVWFGYDVYILNGLTRLLVPSNDKEKIIYHQSSLEKEFESFSQKINQYSDEEENVE